MKDLTQKCTMLLGLLSAQRCQTIHLIKVSNIKFYENKMVIGIMDNLKQTKIGIKNPILQFEKYERDIRLCVVETAETYLSRTECVRKDDQLLLSYCKPHRAVSKATISRWIREVMNMSGIDTNVFGAHSIRGAASSAAASSGVPVEIILNTAGWTNANTFATFYQRNVVTQDGSPSVCSTIQSGSLSN